MNILQHQGKQVHYLNNFADASSISYFMRDYAFSVFIMYNFLTAMR